MEIVHEMSLDLQQVGARQILYAKQGDSMTRTARLLLFDGGTEFTVPSGTIMQIAYAKPDGKGGVYDTMPDGSAACTVSGNVVTAKLHPQMFSVAGIVACELRLLTGSGAQLSTFSWFITVQASAAEGIVSEDYFRFASLDGLRSDVGDLSKLSTAAKDNIVAAINEVLGKFGELDAEDISANVDGIPAGNVAIALAYLLDIIDRLDARDILSQDFGGTVYDVLLYLQALAQPYVVNMTKNADGTYTADKTFDALKAAHDAGQTVICSFQDLTMQWVGPCRLPLVYISDTAMWFENVVDPEQDYMAYVCAYINNDGMGHTATEIAAKETVSDMIAAEIGDTATALSDMDSVIGGAAE
ncbi:MAG: hypothetical protein ACI3VQ_08850 [Faecousia sp.]